MASAKTPGSDCVSSTAWLVLRGLGAGLAWTVGVDAYALLGAAETPRELRRPLLRLGARNMLGFAAFLGIFGGVSCSMEKLRGRSDRLNPFCGGFAAGVAILPLELRSPRLVLTTATLCGLASMAFHSAIPASDAERTQN